jgi:hypothetical protein
MYQATEYLYYRENKANAYEASFLENSVSLMKPVFWRKLSIAYEASFLAKTLRRFILNELKKTNDLVGIDVKLDGGVIGILFIFTGRK